MTGSISIPLESKTELVHARELVCLAEILQTLTPYPKLKMADDDADDNDNDELKQASLLNFSTASA